jgi:hypothetical protein
MKRSKNSFWHALMFGAHQLIEVFISRGGILLIIQLMILMFSAAGAALAGLLVITDRLLFIPAGKVEGNCIPRLNFNS